MAQEVSESLTLESIPRVVRECLERKGVMGDLKARIRAEVFHALEDKASPCPSKPRGVFLASELIRDYLQSFELRSTNAVFIEESGQPVEMLIDRHFLGEELGVNLVGASEDVPLLVLLIEHLTRLKNAKGGRPVSPSGSLEVQGFQHED